MPSASAWSSPPVPRPRTVPARIALPLVPPGPAKQIDRTLRARVRPGVASVVSDLAEAGPKNAAGGCRPSVFRRSQPDRVRTRRRRRLPRTPTVASLTDGCSHRMAGAHCQTTCGASFHFTAYGSAGVRVRPTHVAPRPKFPCARRAQRCDRGKTMSTTHASLPPALDMGPGGPVARFLCGGGVSPSTCCTATSRHTNGARMLVSPIGPPCVRSPLRSMWCGEGQLRLRQRGTRSVRGPDRGWLRGRALRRPGCRG